MRGERARVVDATTDGTSTGYILVEGNFTRASRRARVVSDASR